MLPYLLQPFARFLLRMTGWSPISPSQQARFERHPKAVYIYPHTSTWDFVWGLVYKCAYPRMFGDLWMIMKPQPFERWYGWWLPLAGFLPATRREERNRGFVKKVLKILDPYPRCHILISPEGTRVASPWRTGYYYLAQGLRQQDPQRDCPIAVFGLDYERHCAVLCPPRFLQDFPDYASIEKSLQAQMEHIVPLYPSCSPIHLRPHTTTTILHWSKFLQVLVVGIWIVAIVNLLN
jgi:1-acyl-sn-glycerol-3-phosphate acyltransferase